VESTNLLTHQEKSQTLATQDSLVPLTVIMNLDIVSLNADMGVGTKGVSQATY